MVFISGSELNKLTCFQQCLEKSVSTTVEHLQKFSNYDIPETFLIQEKDRQTERKVLQADNKDIVDKIKSKITFLKQNKVLNSSELKQFKNEMIMIQDSIQNLIKNNKMKIKALNIEYIDLNQDVDYYKEKMFEWSQPINIKDTVNIKSDNKKPYAGLKCVEMREFIDFVKRSGGHENGWDKEDHQLFLKLRNRFKDVNTVAQKVNELLPDKSLEDVKEHDEWYKRYVILKRNKKEALKKWQLSKTEKKLPPTTISEETPKKMIITLPQDDLKEKLMKWKLEKETNMRKNLSLVELQEQKNKELEDMKRKRNEEMKKIVEEWKSTKISLEKENIMRKKIVEKNERKRKAAEAKKMIKQFQSQDDYYILKMRQQKTRLEALKPVRSKSSQVVKRDPERVLKPTKQWINRVHDDNIYSLHTIIPLRKLPKLRVPEWRKQLIA